MNYGNIRIISIEGNIGSGKTTFLKLVKEYFSNRDNIFFVNEPVKIWEKITSNDGENIITKFYNNKKEFSFSFQILAYITRINTLEECIKKNYKDDGRIYYFISERSIYTDKFVFAKFLTDKEFIKDIDFKIYLEVFKTYEFKINLSGLIYLKSTIDKCLENIKIRGREGEELINLDYLKINDEYHDIFINEMNCKKLFLDTNINKDHLEKYLSILDDFLISI